MSAQDTGFNLELSRRRKLLAAAGFPGGAVMAASLSAQEPPDPTCRTPITRSGAYTSGPRDNAA